jgi:hypothetical protein
MKVENLSLGNRFNDTVAVQTGGGRQTHPTWMSQVSDKDLEQAISDSLRSSGLFRAVVGVGQSDFLLNATIVNLKQPVAFGATYIEIVWALTAKGRVKPCWEKVFTGRGTSAAFVGVTRARHAAEAAVQDNIRKALEDLSQVQLPEKGVNP